MELVTCDCGARYAISKKPMHGRLFTCKYCGKSYGICEAKLVNDEDVSKDLKNIAKVYHTIIATYIDTHIEDWDMNDYIQIIKNKDRLVRKAIGKC